MKKSDFLVIVIVIIILAPFFIFDSVFNGYLSINSKVPLLMAFVKFAILATFGEMLALRIKTGKYVQPNYGFAPKAIIWGLFGIWIAIAMAIFKVGVPAFLDNFTSANGVSEAMMLSFSGKKLLGAFCISVVMNTFFAPVFMTFHKITDTHIALNNGKFNSLVKAIPIGSIISDLDWKVQWNFVLKKTIPLFWIPAHTITFILPSEFQVLFAALCSIALGLILSIAQLKKD